MNTILQASAIPYRIYKNELQILIITSRNKKKWIIPKGIIESGDTARSTALKETREEAGVSGKVADVSIGNYTYKKWNSNCKVELFALHVTDIYDSWEESSFRKRKWVKAKRAVKKIEPASLASLVEKFIKSVKIDLIEL